jgi:hypothetical protein
MSLLLINTKTLIWKKQKEKEKEKESNMIIIENNYDHYELLVTLKKSHDN